jgi:hypothetical protein
MQSARREFGDALDPSNVSSPSSGQDISPILVSIWSSEQAVSYDLQDLRHRVPGCGDGAGVQRLPVAKHFG